MVTERTGDAPIYSKEIEMVEPMGGEPYIEDFMRAVR